MRFLSNGCRIEFGSRCEEGPQLSDKSLAKRTATIFNMRPRRFAVTVAVSAILLAASVFGWATSYIPATSGEKAIHWRSTSAIVASDSGIVGLMLYDTSNGWRNVGMVWEVAVPYWLLTLAFGV